MTEPSRTASPAAERDEARTKAAGWLAGSIALATAAATFAGASGGNLDRIIRFHPVLFGSAVFLFVAAVVAGASGGLYRGATWLVPTGIAVFLIGIVLVLVAHSRAIRDQERPTTTATLERGDGAPLLKVTIKASGLDHDQYVFLLVQGMNHRSGLDFYGATHSSSGPPAPENRYYLQRVYKSRIGSSPEGKVDVVVDIPISGGLYEQVRVVAQVLRTGQQDQEVDQAATEAADCQGNRTVSCVTLLVPADVNRPSAGPPLPTPTRTR